MKTKKWQNLNKIFIKGKVRYNFLFKKDFDMIITFTPKDTIVNIECDNLFKLPFKIGDNLSLLKEWVSENKYTIYCEINRY